MHFFPSPSHTQNKSLNRGSAYIDFFGLSETRICFLKNTCHWIPFSLTCNWNFCFNNFHFLQRLPLYLLKMTIQKSLLLSLHFLLSCSVILSSVFLSLSLSSFPPAVGNFQPLQSQSSQSFRKGPFCRALFGGFLINHFRYCCLLGEMGTKYFKEKNDQTLSNSHSSPSFL